MIYEFGIYDAQSQVPPIIKSVVVYQPKAFLGATDLHKLGYRRAADGR